MYSKATAYRPVYRESGLHGWLKARHPWPWIPAPGEYEGQRRESDKIELTVKVSIDITFHGGLNVGRMGC